jgi:hypothetical protein
VAPCIRDPGTVSAFVIAVAALVVLSGLALVVPALALHSSMSYGHEAWQSLGRRRWAVVFALPPIGAAAALVYFLRLEPKLRRVGRLPTLEPGQCVRIAHGPSKGRTGVVVSGNRLMMPIVGWLMGYIWLRLDGQRRLVAAHRGSVETVQDRPLDHRSA